jgi:aminoglycoside/choline kinase family phosphotransferase/dTDP-glucose pyrophosphorylase
MKALILAAGYGNRLRPYTNHTPKALFSIAGRPLMDILIQNLQKAGCKAVMINTHHLHHQIEAFIAAQNYHLKVDTIHEPHILGTGGAIKNLADFWDDEPFMVINADIVTDIDLLDVYRAHCRRHSSATLVLHDDPEFNTVSVAQNKWVIGFDDHFTASDRKSGRLMTFTGIQVLEPEILKYIPTGTSYSSIDAYKQLLADGKKIAAFVSLQSMWQDIGTPERYRQAAIDKAVPSAFERAFGTQPRRRICKVRLRGDGSQRQWYRLTSEQGSLIMADHGIRKSSKPAEVDSFINIGRHLYRQRAPIAKIYFHDAFCGLVFVEDLGNVSLQQAARSIHGTKALADLYKSVIEQLIKLSQSGAGGFNPAWTYQTANYNQKLILENECRYFLDAFLVGYIGLNTRYEELEADFISLARKALKHSTVGFMHRDLQSRNIMVKGNKIYFIDYQGGRIGPVQYDLASLLIDPYVELSHALQSQLLEASIEMLSTVTAVEADKFRLCYDYCSLTRNLQILGAFAFLSNVKAKKYFQKYIPAAVKSLKHNLAEHGQKEFPDLNAAVNEVYRRLQTG